MINRYVVVVSYADRSGIIQAFGPFDSEGEADRAKAVIPDALPALEGGLWEVVLTSDLESQGELV